MIVLGFLFSTTRYIFTADGTIDTGDTAWVTMSTALVMMMTPAGLALFYGGMSRYKNLLNTIAMTLVAYCIASLVWGGGWMHKLGALDFAGGNVVHINAGISGLVLALCIGKRKGYGKEAMIPSSVAFTALGAGLLWLDGLDLMPAVRLQQMGLLHQHFL